MTEPKPSAWLYKPTEALPPSAFPLSIAAPFSHTERANMDPRYWTETPTYTREAIEAEIVAWLRGKGAERLARVGSIVSGGGWKYDLGMSTMCDKAADAIERGEYRSKSDG